MLKDILLILLGIGIGSLIGFLIAKKYMEKYLEKNPPIKEDMIKMLMYQMGWPVNQNHINQMMKQIKNKQQTK